MQFGAKCDGDTANPTDDTAAIMRAVEAVAALPGGGEVHFPSGICVVSGLTLVDKRVTLVGQGGGCEWFLPGDPRDVRQYCGTVIRSKSNAPIVKLTVRSRDGGMPSRFWVGLRDLAIEGSGTARFADFNDQHCLQVDNRGIAAYNITLIHCGGHGLYLTDAVIGSFYNLRVADNNGDGINNDASESHNVNGNNFFGGSSVGNGRDGFHVTNGGWGTSTFGFVFEGNAGYGINLVGATSNGYVRFTRFMSTWDEVNKLGSVRFGDNAYDNLVDFIRYSSAPPIFEKGSLRNLVWGSNVRDDSTFANQAIYHSFRKILSVPDLTQNDEITVRNRSDTTGGTISLGVLKATGQASDAEPATAGAIRLPNGAAIMSRSADKTKDIELMSTGTDDTLSIGAGAAALRLATGSVLFNTPYSYTSLPPRQPNGTMAYCSDCTMTRPCAAGGTGAFAKRLNGTWICN
jgi:hypothetical protein